MSDTPETTKTGLRSSESQSTTRLLLALWELGAHKSDEVKRVDLTEKIKRTGEKASDYQSIFDKLEQEGAIAFEMKNRNRVIFLTEKGVQLLGESLYNPEFEFDSQIGARTANALLRWMREMASSGNGASATAKEEKGEGAIASSRHALKTNCQVVADVPPVLAALDKTRLTHLKCEFDTLINDPHISTAAEAEREFWHHQQWQEKLEQLSPGCILVVGYAPSVLMSACAAIEQKQLQPALIIGMPIGFSHAPAAKRRLMRSGVPFITTEGTLGGGLLAAVALNALVESLIEKPDCHCYFG